eukprot:6801535-Prymnesium_polylepis.1
MVLAAPVVSPRPLKEPPSFSRIAHGCASLQPCICITESSDTSQGLLAVLRGHVFGISSIRATALKLPPARLHAAPAALWRALSVACVAPRKTPTQS